MGPQQERKWRASKCRCCLHQQKVSGWQKAWCAETCIHLRFPQELRDEYEILQRCITWKTHTVSAGMGASSVVEPEFNSDEFRLQMDMGEIPRRYWEEIRESLRDLFALWHGSRDGKHGFSEQDYAEAVRLSGPVAEEVDAEAD